MKYKGLFPDTFFDVEADSEDEAQRKMLAQLRESLDKHGALDSFIVWTEPDQLSEQQS
jgi:hypothetical protein